MRLRFHRHRWIQAPEGYRWCLRCMAKGRLVTSPGGDS